MVVKGITKKATKKVEKQTLKFVVDCEKPVNDNVIDAESLAEFFRNRIKVEGKTGNLGERVTVAKTGKAKIVVTASAPFSKRYLKYLTKKYLKKQLLRDFLRVVASNKNTYELRYFSINQEE
ncbi:60S ribosomal protein L22, putative [Perkinsus marinus ATCC 50983]|uniref:Large ribosomal subunit protein eL22 n=1 Tax=Perkinsus marinus (strain ATCC 50983 / TXsc) TaxID=423536 RepID=C5KLD9_PERM5|nr:60S ribosomal protein L22, putative [Perkinsus marinus ATCC 50983]XP_002768156.1 60S ribosomal protein L22, putative [Perkinsus marinus ATCC 50983]XP_002782908.1 60S ribosomal protein L22, putative [Perkinsus marinus ATCC 50983]EER00872.1 60S ribosomal protein L22, putative [Perkinsus marinus ATCC 50983]EER00874.1 60S ribosomal protein L22, putative [Perkinsus marinus ATCC 50983]EER14704.1 60S ribosomal protein L22, putative [Perkinsus marinus ATCC 50983]|eukprot:XP_002768154.1 60S ribosomal protein L22, putative [Perkinsus marinus ATCC 50983]